MRGSSRKLSRTNSIIIVGCFISLLSILSIRIVHSDSPSALATTWYVPDDFPNIQSAIDAATTGDIILVAPGVYTENLLFNGKSVTLQSTDGPPVTTIDGNNAGTTIDIGPQGHLIGFKITNGQAAFGAGIMVHGAGTVINGNIFDNNVQTAGGFGAGIGGNSSSPTIDGNIFRNNSCDNQFLSGVVSFVNSSSPHIVNNIFEDNPCRAINITLPTGPMPLVSNNTIVRNNTGIRVDARVNTAAHIYQNNIIVSNTIGMDVDFGSPSNYPTWQYNLVFDNNTNYDEIPDQTGSNNNISADPLLADALNGNYELTLNSPAINAGNNTNCPSIDFRGLSRPQNGICEIGAFEIVLVFLPIVLK